MIFLIANSYGGPRVVLPSESIVLAHRPAAVCRLCEALCYVVDFINFFQKGDF